MKPRFAQICIGCVGLVLSQQAAAFFVDGVLNVTVGTAQVFVSGHSSKYEISVTQLEVEATITEEGNPAGSGGKYCARQNAPGGGLEDIHCTAMAEDESVTVGCEYCGTGKATPFYYYYPGSPEYWGIDPPECDNTEPGGGGGPGGGGDPP